MSVWLFKLVGAWLIALCLAVFSYASVAYFIGEIQPNDLLSNSLLGLLIFGPLAAAVSVVPMAAVAAACLILRPTSRSAVFAVVFVVFLLAQIALLAILTWLLPSGDPMREPSIDPAAVWFFVGAAAIMGLLVPRVPPRTRGENRHVHCQGR
jgi:hypothetical protein